MSIDEELLARSNNTEEEEDEAVSAGNFRESQRGQAANSDVNPGAGLREMKMAEKIENEGNSKVVSEKKGGGGNPLAASTDKLLQSAWMNLIPTFGLTLIWIDIHWFLNKVLGPTAFRELGEEWVPDNIKKLGEEKVKEVTGLTKKVEEIGCGCVNLGSLFILIGIIALVSMIAQAIAHPLQTAWDMIANGTAVEALISMIKGLL